MGVEAKESKNSTEADQDGPITTGPTVNHHKLQIHQTHAELTEP